MNITVSDGSATVPPPGHPAPVHAAVIYTATI